MKTNQIHYFRIIMVYQVTEEQNIINSVNSLYFQYCQRLELMKTVETFEIMSKCPNPNSKMSQPNDKLSLGWYTFFNFWKAKILHQSWWNDQIIDEFMSKFPTYLKTTIKRICPLCWCDWKYWFHVSSIFFIHRLWVCVWCYVVWSVQNTNASVLVDIC